MKESLLNLSSNSAERILLIQDTRYTKSQIAMYLEREERHAKEIRDYTLARQIVVSLNIIYLFCDALKKIITKKELKAQAIAQPTE